MNDKFQLKWIQIDHGLHHPHSNRQDLDNNLTAQKELEDHLQTHES